MLTILTSLRNIDQACHKWLPMKTLQWRTIIMIVSLLKQAVFNFWSSIWSKNKCHPLIWVKMRNFWKSQKNNHISDIIVARILWPQIIMRESRVILQCHLSWTITIASKVSNSKRLQLEDFLSRVAVTWQWRMMPWLTNSNKSRP